MARTTRRVWPLELRIQTLPQVGADVFYLLFKVLAAYSGLEYTMIDGTIIKVHRSGQGAQSQAIGRSRGGITTKVLALTDAPGNLIDFRLMSGQAHGLREVPARIEPLPAGSPLADRAFDADWLRSALKNKDITPVIPPKSNRKFPATFDEDTYKMATSGRKLFRKAQGKQRHRHEIMQNRSELCRVHRGCCNRHSTQVERQQALDILVYF